MRKTYRKNDLKELNRQIIILGIIFIISVTIGSYLNKIWPSYQSSITENINPILDYYNTKDGIREAIISNLKMDITFMGVIAISSLLIITCPIILIVFILKGLSTGYTINSIILALNLKSAKFILILLLKNISIIPGMVILMIVSFEYIKKVLIEIRNNKYENIIFLAKRYVLNVIIILIITVVLQAILNATSIGIIKFLVR